MLHIRIKIDGREYVIPTEEEAQAIMETITGQLRAGGGFVEIVRTPDRSVSVLVSSGIGLAVERNKVDDAPVVPAVGARYDLWPDQSWIDSMDTY